MTWGPDPSVIEGKETDDIPQVIGRRREVPLWVRVPCSLPPPSISLDSSILPFPSCSGGRRQDGGRGEDSFRTNHPPLEIRSSTRLVSRLEGLEVKRINTLPSHQSRTSCVQSLLLTCNVPWIIRELFIFTVNKTGLPFWLEWLHLCLGLSRSGYSGRHGPCENRENSRLTFTRNHCFSALFFPLHTGFLTWSVHQPRGLVSPTGQGPTSEKDKRVWRPTRDSRFSLINLGTAEDETKG